MKLLQLMLNLDEARGIKDDLYYIITGGRKVDLYTERGFKSSEAAEKYLKAEHDDAHDSGVYDHGLDSCEVMRGAALKKNFTKIFEAGRTFTIKNDAIKGRGAPEEKARAFDKVNPKTGARPNRSVLKKMQKDAEDFTAIQAEEDKEYTMCLVMSNANFDDLYRYFGVNVLFFPDGHVEGVAGDSKAEKEWKNHRNRIIKVAREFLKKKGAFDRDIEGPSDYHGYHDPKTNEAAEPNNAAWLKNAPFAKMEKFKDVKLPEPVKRALAAKLSHGEINDLLKALGI